MTRLTKSRKGAQNMLLGFGISFVALIFVLGILLGVTGQTLGAYRTSLNSTSSGGEANTAFAVVDASLNGTMNFARNMPTIGTMASIGVVLAIVAVGLVVLVGKFGSGGGGGGSGGGFG